MKHALTPVLGWPLTQTVDWVSVLRKKKHEDQQQNKWKTSDCLSRLNVSDLWPRGLTGSRWADAWATRWRGEFASSAHWRPPPRPDRWGSSTLAGSHLHKHTQTFNTSDTHAKPVFSSSCLFSMNVCLMFKYFLFDLYLYTLLYSLIKTRCLIYKSDLCQTNIKIAAIEETIE